MINQKRLEIRSSFEEAVSTVSAIAKEKDIDVVKKLSRSLPKLLADPDRLRQILVHLLSNAIKFSDRGSRVEISDRPARQVYVRLPAKRKLPPGWNSASA